jgi:hypothetical protein
MVERLDFQQTPEVIAVGIVSSEDFMWLMCGGDDQWIQSHLCALKPAWDAYVAAGGKTYGR